MTASTADWDLASYFPCLGGDEYEQHWHDLDQRADALLQRAQALPLRGAAVGEAWAEFVEEVEELQLRTSHLRSYLSCETAADGTNERAQADMAKLGVLKANQEKLFIVMQSKLADMGDAAFDGLRQHPRLQAVHFPLSRLRQRASWMMPREMEEVAAELGVTGIEAWGRLYNRIGGSLEFQLTPPNQEPRVVPASAARSMMQDDDPALRRAAFAGVNRAWEGVAEPVAACLNAIAGTRHTLYQRRGVQHFLEPALFDACIERRALDAMLDAVRSRQGSARRFLKLKAMALGLTHLSFCDLEASLPREGGTRITWEQARHTVLAAFSTYPALQSFAREAFDKHWIDHTPRAGKRPGAFCSSSRWNDEARVFMTFGGSASDVQTLAHELGHAFHARLLFDVRPYCRSSPMTLAETASLFAEQLVTQSVLENPASTVQERTLTLEGRLSDAATFLLNIPTRFDFEVAVYQERQAGELSISRLKELMLRAQRANYGDTLSEDGLDPWFWASKLHFYITSTSFYNFPYTFGYLFALGLFALYRREPEGFFERYERLLRNTGSDSAETVTRTCIGVDINAPEFWHGCLDLIDADLAEFEALVQPRN